MVKIYFAASIRGGRDAMHLYPPIIERLKKHGEVLTEHVGSQSLSRLGEDVPSEEIYKRDMRLIKEADVVVVETTNPSLGTGYEVAIAEQLRKKILCLYMPAEGRSLTAMIRGNKNLIVKDYHDLKEAFMMIDEFFKQQL